MVVHPIRIYADTSVFGGAFDDEFKNASTRFFAEVRHGRFRLVLSSALEGELALAPPEVRTLFNEMLASCERLETTAGALRLREAYLSAKVVGPSSAVDALHIALATVARCSIVVSWNFKHHVHFQKIPLYNAINIINGYQPIAIHSPREVIEHEDESV